jgi:hypothetical protein
MNAYSELFSSNDLLNLVKQTAQANNLALPPIVLFKFGKRGGRTVFEDYVRRGKLEPCGSAGGLSVYGIPT